jgi:hypothetical protein
VKSASNSDAHRARSDARLDVAERRRRAIVRCVFILFVMLVFEGSMRKWIAPQMAQYLYFMRDPVALVLYVMALRNGAFRPLHPLLAAGLTFAVIAIPIAVIQCVSGGSPNQTMFEIYGWRNYFWYLPLPFVIASQFRERDLNALGKLAVVLLTIAAGLSLVQFQSAPDSIWNAGAAEDEALQFKSLRSANGHIRPTGTFTSTLGLVEMTVSTAALVLSSWILPRKERPMNSAWLLTGALSVALSLSVSGSRTMFLAVGIVVLGGIMSGFVMRRTERMMRAITIPIVLVLVFVMLFPLVFAEGYATITSRWDEASQSEARGVFGRVTAELLDSLRLVGDVPILGYGIGLGGNAAQTLQVSGGATSSIPYTETDWARHMVDLGPLVGLCFIIYRLVFTWRLGAAALAATRVSQRPLPLLAFSYVGIVLLEAQVTGNGIVNGFCWLYVGICMAASRQKSPVAPEVGSPEDTALVVVTRRPGNLMR